MKPCGGSRTLPRAVHHRMPYMPCCRNSCIHKIIAPVTAVITRCQLGSQLQPDNRVQVHRSSYSNDGLTL